MNNDSRLRTILRIILCISGSVISCAQTHQVISTTVPVQPNTVKVIARLIKLTNDSAILKISEVELQGQGIVNVLNEGDTVTVKSEKKIKPLLGKKVEAYLKENLETDASKSYYTISSIKQYRDY